MGSSIDSVEKLDEVYDPDTVEKETQVVFRLVLLYVDGERHRSSEASEALCFLGAEQI